MKIYEAARMANELGKGMIREPDLNNYMNSVIVPTNSYNRCIGTLNRESSSELRRFNPSPEDLIADDWVVETPR